MTNNERYPKYEQREDEFQNFCAQYGGCKGCPLWERSGSDCERMWGAMSAEEPDTVTMSQILRDMQDHINEIDKVCSKDGLVHRGATNLQILLQEYHRGHDD